MIKKPEGYMYSIFELVQLELQHHAKQTNLKLQHYAMGQ